ncbi:serine/threonine-protein kinase LATS1-like isoform X3 [Parambassis ranga]|uniref:Serine/threonine-protein kinase LATS1-like isoform X3 n=1 Tax=Parambassis ranga TaxID=210632 RepID=A0A6P7HEU5_9TELE|nr:serine/threonine-protein kinase LATS1-like isoform X3 [Parambassis ranga]
MKRGEKPEGYRQMRPKTFPASNYSGNSQQMLQEIRNSLRNLSKPSDQQPKVDVGEQGKMHPEDPRQQGRCSNPKNPYHKALQEIRKSLLPFANKSNTSGPEDNKHMSLDLPCAGFEEPSSIRGAGVVADYMGKVSYQDSMAIANPNNIGLKAPGAPHIQQAVLRRPSWKGSKESLAPRHGPLMVDGMMYRSDSPGPPPAFPQGHPGNSQRVNPPLPPQVRSVTPPPNRGAMPPASSWDSNPSTKRYSGNMDYLGPRISPVPQGAWPDGYPAAAAAQNQRGISPVPVGHQPIIMQSSGANKFTFPSSWTQNGSTQPDYMGGTSRQPPPPYPVNQSSRHSPTDQQMQGPGSSPSYVNGGNIPQSMMVPNRNSHNLDMYSIGPPQSWPQPPLASNQPQSSSGNSSNQDLSPSWQHNIPVRSNSFNNHQLNGRPAHPASSQPSATTVTAITQAPILQPVKSMRVQKPELHTAVAPTHPPWLQQVQPSTAATAYPEPPASVTQIPVTPEVPSYQGPPPPYPKHLLQQQAAPCPPAYDAGVNRLSIGREEPAEGESATGDNPREEASESPESAAATEREKQITTSPVPVRRNKKDEERRGESGRVALYSPQAFKFFMEQHVENILKSHHMRIRRRKQLESEMQRLI